MYQAVIVELVKDYVPPPWVALIQVLCCLLLNLNKFGNAFNFHLGQARILQSVRSPFSGTRTTPAPRPVERQDARDAQVHLRRGDGREAGH